MKNGISGFEKEKYVKEVFRRIAPKYDFMNRLMTGGFDHRWKEEVVKLAQIQDNDRILDLGAGTGDLAKTVNHVHQNPRVVAADFSFEMMSAGRTNMELPFVQADALSLPFADDTFNCVVSGYLLRNVSHLDQALSEIFRVIKRDGRFVVLDTTKPGRNIFSPFIWVHMHWIIPLIGGIVSGFRAAYEYLPNSSEQFLSAEELEEQLKIAGFVSVGFRRLMFGTIAIHWAKKGEI